jgi:hypothetical protein
MNRISSSRVVPGWIKRLNADIDLFSLDEWILPWEKEKKRKERQNIKKFPVKGRGKILMANKHSFALPGLALTNFSTRERTFSLVLCRG